MKIKSTVIVLSVEFILAMILVVLYYFVHSHLTSFAAAITMLLIYLLGCVTKTTGERVIHAKLDEIYEELK
jgi:hypothetical protein